MKNLWKHGMALGHCTVLLALASREWKMVDLHVTWNLCRRPRGVKGPRTTSRHGLQNLRRDRLSHAQNDFKTIVTSLAIGTIEAVEQPTTPHIPKHDTLLRRAPRKDDGDERKEKEPRKRATGSKNSPASRSQLGVVRL